jgi:hypothetical protein
MTDRHMMVKEKSEALCVSASDQWLEVLQRSEVHQLYFILGQSFEESIPMACTSPRTTTF